jgi:hypothetical protein
MRLTDLSARLLVIPAKERRILTEPSGNLPGPSGFPMKLRAKPPEYFKS